MTFVERMSILQGPQSFSRNIHKDYFPEKPCVSFISKISAATSGIRKLTRCFESNISAPGSDILPSTNQVILQIFVLGPSNFGKERLLECAANRHLEIPTAENIAHAYELKGFLLKGVEVAINLWHIGNIFNSLGIMQDFHRKGKTCFMLVYDVNEFVTFQYAHDWVNSLKRTLGDHVPIVLVGYEDYGETLTSKLTPVSYADGMKAKENLDLKAYYEFSDMTGPAVGEMVFDAAHIALES